MGHLDKDLMLVPENISLPSGQVFDVSELMKNLDRLEFGNRTQIETLQAFEYLGLIEKKRRLWLDKPQEAPSEKFLLFD